MKIKLAGRTAIVLAAAVTAAGFFVASGGSASANDSTSEYCSTYHSWTECITYDFTQYVLQVTAYNGYGVAENGENVWIGSSGEGKNFNIPAFGTYGYGQDASIDNQQFCGGIGSQTIVCGSF